MFCQISHYTLKSEISGETILGSYAQNQEIVYSNWDIFFGFIPGSVGETSTFLILLGAAFLIFTKILGLNLSRILMSSALSLIGPKLKITKNQMRWRKLFLSYKEVNAIKLL